MPTSAEDLANKQANITRLREQVAAEEAKRLAREASLSNDLVGSQLDQETANLERQLLAAKAVNKSATSAPSRTGSAPSPVKEN